jgi:uncharacterized protein (DUF1778 family)
MSPKATRTARLNFRLPANLKAVIEEAATQVGQSTSAFAISTLVTSARAVLQQQNATELSNRDRDIFLALLDDTRTTPNNALKKAAARYKKNLG